MTLIELVQEEGRKRDRKISACAADWIIWEHTGYPVFWNIPRDGATPEECMRTQVCAFLDGPDAVAGLGKT